MRHSDKGEKGGLPPNPRLYVPSRSMEIFPLFLLCIFGSRSPPRPSLSLTHICSAANPSNAVSPPLHSFVPPPHPPTAPLPLHRWCHSFSAGFPSLVLSLPLFPLAAGPPPCSISPPKLLCKSGRGGGGMPARGASANWWRKAYRQDTGVGSLDPEPHHWACSLELCRDEKSCRKDWGRSLTDSDWGGENCRLGLGSIKRTRMRGFFSWGCRCIDKPLFLCSIVSSFMEISSTPWGSKVDLQRGFDVLSLPTRSAQLTTLSLSLLVWIFFY